MGASLKGWVPPAGADKTNFAIRNGAIHITGSGGWLHTDKVYANYTLHVTFRFVSPDGTGNTGIFMRSSEASTFGPRWPASRSKSKCVT